MAITKDQAQAMVPILAKLKEGQQPNTFSDTEQNLLDSVLKDPEFTSALQQGESLAKQKGLDPEGVTTEQANAIADEVFAKSTTPELSPLSKAILDGLTGGIEGK
jgi:hypothetical protein